MLENNFYPNGLDLNIANILIGTTALGPGYRAVVWVQGCPFHCPGCYSQSWIPQTRANLYTPLDLADIITSHGDIDGITISGGEPMLQAQNLIEFIKKVKIIKPNYSYILYTGYRKESIDRLSLDDPRVLLLDQLDVLIDGLYIDRFNNNLGLKGSTNQKVWHFSDRLRDYNFETEVRKNEIVVKNGEVHFIGVPDIRSARLPQKLEKEYVRT